jgi:uncharacterized protein (DUF4415 family)
MKYRKLESLVHEKRLKKNVKPTKDDQIDLSDIPELGDKQLKGMKRIGRPPFGDVARQMIAVRIDNTVLESLRVLAKKQKKGYQSLINEILGKYFEKKAA